MVLLPLLLSAAVSVPVHPGPPPDHLPAPAAVRAAAVLHAWDARRAAAWAEADVAALGALYTARSATGRADVAMLAAWRSRGLRVVGMRTQLLRLEVQAASRRRIAVRVVDRLVGGSVVPSGVALPVDRPTGHTVVLRRVTGEWLVARAGPLS
jgi:hypothetical protein